MMRITLRTPYTLMLPKEAIALAVELNADPDKEEGVTYEAKHDPCGTGWSFVILKDDDGTILGNL